jgi:hypothetical protein
MFHQNVVPILGVHRLSHILMTSSKTADLCSAAASSLERNVTLTVLQVVMKIRINRSSTQSMLFQYLPFKIVFQVICGSSIVEQVVTTANLWKG